LENPSPACFNLSPDQSNDSDQQLSSGGEYQDASSDSIGSPLEKAEYDVVFVLIDGDMQLTRFKDVTSQKTPFQEWEVLPSKMFLNIDQQFYGTVSQLDPNDEEQPLETEVEESEQCASQFKASRGWESNACRNKELAS